MVGKTTSLVVSSVKWVKDHLTINYRVERDLLYYIGQRRRFTLVTHKHINLQKPVHKVRASGTSVSPTPSYSSTHDIIKTGHQQDTLPPGRDFLTTVLPMGNRQEQ